MWIKENENVNNLREYIKETTGYEMEDILKTPDTDTFVTPKISELADLLFSASKKGTHICVLGDFDADGLHSILIFAEILAELKANFSLIIPKRESEGYGFSEQMIDRIPENSILILVDNGITAVEPIKLVKEQKNATVVIFDHHHAGGTIPNADLIIDPEWDNKGWTFSEYCAAGLCYKLARAMFPMNQALLNRVVCYAAIATRGDVMPILGDNRNIVKEGLKLMNESKIMPIDNAKCSLGMKVLIDQLSKFYKIEHIDEETLDYKFAPVANAPGRLNDDGGKLYVSAVASKNKEKAEKLTFSVYEANEKRKELVDKAVNKCHPNGEKIHFLYDKNIIGGICGIIAGHLAEDSKPSFVMTSAGDGIIKGSARSKEGNNVFDLLNAASPYLIKFGGHDYAAGFSFSEENIEKVFKALEDNANVVENTKNQKFSFEVKPNEMYQLYNDTTALKPFGNGMPVPIIKTRIKVDSFKDIGADKTHISMVLECGIRAIGFSLSKKYHDLGEPTDVILYGSIGANWYRGTSSPQLQILDIETP